MGLGAHLRRLRGGRPVDTVSERVGVVRSTVYLWEADDRRPEPEHLQALLDLYEATDDERLEAWRLRSLPPPVDASVPPTSSSSPAEV